MFTLLSITALLQLTTPAAQARIGCDGGATWNGSQCICSDGQPTKGSWNPCASDRFETKSSGSSGSSTPTSSSGGGDGGGACSVIGFGAPAATLAFAGLAALRRRRTAQG